MKTKPLISAGIWYMAFLLILLTGCGFHPRGEHAVTAANLSPATISGLPAHHNLVRTLTRQLRDAGISMADRAQDAATEIRIHKQKTDRQVMSVDDRRKTVEYEIRESLEYSIKRASGDAPTERQTLTAQRILFNPGTDLLGRNREELMLRHDMHEELSRRLIQRLSRSDH